MKPKTVRERFLAKVGIPETADGCWPWLGAKTGRTGEYGSFHAGRKSASGKPVADCAHRVAYELFVGPIPEGLELDHLCRNPGCVNPAHLEPVTRRENQLRGESPMAKQARQTHCVHGHPFDEANTYMWHGKRRCRRCGILSRARRNAEKRAARAQA